MRFSDQLLDNQGGAGNAAPTTVPPTTVAPETTLPPAETTLPPEEDIDDARLLAALKRKGLQADNLDGILKKPEEQKTPEQIEAEKKAQKDKAFQFGITSNLFTKDLYDEFVIDTARPKDDIAFQMFKADFLETVKGTEDEESYSDDDIREMFEDKHFLSEDDNSPRKKLGQKLIDQAQQAYLNNKYGKVLTAEQELAAHEAEVKKATEYKGIVDQAFSQLPQKLKFNVEGVEVNFEPTAEILGSVKELYANEAAYKTFAAGATPETIIEAVKHNIAMKDLPRLLKEAAVAYHAQKIQGYQMGRIGALPDRGIAGGTTGGGGRHSDAMLEANRKK